MSANVTINRLEQASGQSADSYTDHRQKMTVISFRQKKGEKKRMRRRKDRKKRFRFRIDADWQIIINIDDSIISLSLSSLK